jgi:hypothetical protein
VGADGFAVCTPIFPITKLLPPEIPDPFSPITWLPYYLVPCTLLSFPEYQYFQSKY